MYETLDRKIIVVLNKSTITNTKTINLPQADWINSEFVQAINNRNLLFGVPVTVKQTHQIQNKERLYKS